MNNPPSGAPSTSAHLPEAGRTARYGVVGDPVAHSKSPLIHRHFALATQQQLSYEKFHVRSAELQNFVRDFFADGGDGLNITVPHKQTAALIADELTPRAHQAGAVNTLLKHRDGKLIGDNTDGAGLIADLARLGVMVGDQNVVIIGAGGAVRGILGPLLALSPRQIWIANRNPENAQRLAEDFRAENHACAIRTSALSELASAGCADLLLQATPLSLQGDLPSLPDLLIGPQSAAYDLGYGDAPTAFELWARQHGAWLAASGLGMLIEQAAEAFHVWRGIRPDTMPLHISYRSSSANLSNNP